MKLPIFFKETFFFVTGPTFLESHTEQNFQWEVEKLRDLAGCCHWLRHILALFGLIGKFIKTLLINVRIFQTCSDRDFWQFLGKWQFFGASVCILAIFNVFCAIFNVFSAHHQDQRFSFNLHIFFFTFKCSVTTMSN